MVEDPIAIARVTLARALPRVLAVPAAILVLAAAAVAGGFVVPAGVDMGLWVLSGVLAGAAILLALVPLTLRLEVEVGGLYLGRVTRIMAFGAFVEILPGKEGLVRIGELADYHVPTVEDVVAIGDEIMVVVTEIDRQGRINMSRKAAMQRHQAKTPA